MTLLYDDVIGELLLAIQHTPAFQQVQRAVLVRTSEGRVRLVLELNDTASSDLVARLEATAADAIGSWFQGPIISPFVPKSAGLRRLATHLLSTSSPWPSGWPTELPVAPGAPPEQVAPQWSALQVAVGKAPWLPIHPGRPPWRFVAEAPTITAFYGYKGGVGRTTAVAALGTLLASRGRRVVCVDLDLEAPGLARALLQTELPDHRGWLIDDLLAHSATGAGLDKLPMVPIQAPLMPGASLDLVPAGVLGPTYLEKLARLDAMHHAENRPTSAAALAVAPPGARAAAHASAAGLPQAALRGQRRAARTATPRPPRVVLGALLRHRRCPRLDDPGRAPRSLSHRRVSRGPERTLDR